MSKELVKLCDKLHVDALTGLHTRHGFIHDGNAKIKKAVTNKEPVTLIYIELDDFGKFKKEHGEKEANAMLSKIGHGLQESFRKSDLLARIHEDEFLLLFRGLASEHALNSIHRVRMVLEELLKELPWQMTANVGAITFLSRPPSLEQMIRKVEPVMHK